MKEKRHKHRHGKIYKTLKRWRRKLTIPFNYLRDSLRGRTIFLLIILLIIFVGVLICGTLVILIFFRLADRLVCQSNVQRFVKTISLDSNSIASQLFGFTYWDYSAQAVEDLAKSPNGSSALWDEWLISNFYVAEKDGTMVWNPDFEINLFALYDSNFKYIFGTYHPPDSETGAVSGITEGTVPDWFKTANVSLLLNGTRKYTGLLTPSTKQDESDFPTLIAAMEPVLDNNVGFYSKAYGWMIWGREFRTFLQQFSDNVPVCLSAWKLGDGKDTEIPTEVQSAITNLSSQSISKYNTFDGFVAYSDTTYEQALKDPGRKCPHVPLWNNSESRVWQGIFRLSDGFPGNSPGPIIRVDRQYVILREIRAPVSYSWCLVVILLILTSIVLAKYLDFAVLKRVDKLSKKILSDPIPHQPKPKDKETDDNENEEEIEIENEAAEMKKTDDDLFSNSESDTATSISQSETASTTASTTTSTQNQKRDANEIAYLRNVVMSNIRAAHSSMTKAKNDLKEEGRKRARHRDAMRLLNLWCGRKGIPLPGLRENALADPRVQKAYTIDHILANPLGVEFLKAHCKQESSMENILFVLDVAWLIELETAQDIEQLEDRKQPLHDAAVAAASAIMSRYILPGAPQEINLSSDTMKTLRMGKGYSRGMFQKACAEIRYVLSSDVLHRFKATSAFVALCEIMDIENGSTVKPIDGTPEASKIIGHRPSDVDEHIPEIGETLVGNNFSVTVLNKAFSQAFNRLRIRKLATPISSPNSIPTSNSPNPYNLGPTPYSPNALSQSSVSPLLTLSQPSNPLPTSSRTPSPAPK